MLLSRIVVFAALLGFVINLVSGGSEFFALLFVWAVVALVPAFVVDLVLAASGVFPLKRG